MDIIQQLEKQLQDFENVIKEHEYELKMINAEINSTSAASKDDLYEIRKDTTKKLLQIKIQMEKTKTALNETNAATTALTSITESSSKRFKETSTRQTGLGQFGFVLVLTPSNGPPQVVKQPPIPFETAPDSLTCVGCYHSLASKQGLGSHHNSCAKYQHEKRKAIDAQHANLQANMRVDYPNNISLLSPSGGTLPTSITSSITSTTTTSSSSNNYSRNSAPIGSSSNPIEL
jgi:hypothetical protein